MQFLLIRTTNQPKTKSQQSVSEPAPQTQSPSQTEAQPKANESQTEAHSTTRRRSTSHDLQMQVRNSKLKYQARKEKNGLFGGGGYLVVCLGWKKKYVLYIVLVGFFSGCLFGIMVVLMICF